MSDINELLLEELDKTPINLTRIKQCLERCHSEQLSIDGRVVMQYMKKRQPDDIIIIMLPYVHNIDYQCEYKQTLLMVAIRICYFQVAQALVDRGASVDVQSSYDEKMTALMYAVSNAACPLTLVRSLIAHGASVNYQIPSGISVLMCAHADAALVLLESDEINLKAMDSKRRDAFTYFIMHYRHASTVNDVCLDRFFELGLSVNQTVGEDDMTYLMIAAIHSNYEIVKYLIDKGAKVNEQDHCGYTALFFSVLPGVYGTDLMANSNCVQLLLANGANPLIQNCYGNSDYDIANRYNHPAKHLMKRIGR